VTYLVQSSINKVRDARRDLAHELVNEMVIRQHVEHVTVNTHTIDSTIKDTEHNLMKFKQAIDLTAMGKLSSYRISPHLMTEMLQISLQLPQGQTLISEPDTSPVFLYYNMVNVHALATKNKIRIFTDMPLKMADRYFELYQV
jgi:hypothetical protein